MRIEQSIAAVEKDHTCRSVQVVAQHELDLKIALMERGHEIDLCVIIDFAELWDFLALIESYFPLT
jgi:hypothetical protein